MAITAFKTFINGEVLLASDLNSSLDTIIDEVNVHGGEIDTLNGSTQGRSRNLITNGDFSVWQRGTSHSTDGYGSADRFSIGASGATLSLGQQTHTLGQTDVPGNPKYFARFDVTTGNDNCKLQTKIEGVATTSSREVTLSFYAKGTNPGGGFITVFTDQNFGTGGSPSSAVTDTITSALAVTTSWQRFTYTFTPSSISGKTLGTNDDDFFEIFLGQGSDTSTDAWQLDISNVQLEFGDTATEFEYVTPADQLARCQRYFERLTIPAVQEFTSGLCRSTTNCLGFISYSTKRDTPSATFSGTGTDWEVRHGGGTTTAVTNIISGQMSLTRADIDATVAAGLTAGAIGMIRPVSGTDATIDIDAEL